jgi:hypothetical protein
MQRQVNRKQFRARLLCMAAGLAVARMAGCGGGQTHAGTHTGIIPAAFADALGFAFAP